MGANSEISWTTHTFNPWIGCTKVSPACAHCYAESYAKRYGKAVWGAHGTRTATSYTNWRKPLKWNREADCNCGAAGRGNSECEWCANGCQRPRVFCASLADVFEQWDGQLLDHHKQPLWFESASDRDADDIPVWRNWRGEYKEPLTLDIVRRELVKLICRTPNLDWLILTKRPENALQMLVDSGMYAVANPKLPCPQPNIWIGTTVENHEEANKRLPHLMNTPAAVRFLSVEPMLGPLDLWPYLDSAEHGPGMDSPRPDWVIVGGESGHGARPMHPDWARFLRDQCESNRVAFHFKQWGDWAPFYDRDKDDPDWRSVPKESSSVCRVNLAGGSGFHGERVVYFRNVGKKKAGRLLDGREWNEFPTVQESKLKVSTAIATKQLTCEGCGLCCMHMSAPPYMPDEEAKLKEIAPHVYADLQAAERSRELQWKVHGVDAIPCGFFDMVTSKCRHHEHKPELCQAFEVGGEDCLAYRKDAFDV